MKRQEGTFVGIRKAGLYYQGWLPEGESKAVLLVVHGLGEHSGRYMNLVDRFIPQGFAVYGIDHLGHGRSEGQRLLIDRFSDYTEPLKAFSAMIRCWQPGKPVFLVGHSMGGLIGATYLLTNQEELAGAILSGPAVKPPGNIPAATVLIGRALSLLFPSLGLVPRGAATDICRDPAVVAAYLADPLVYQGKITARLGTEMLRAMARLRKEAARIRLPLLILQGSADRLVDPAGAQILYDGAASADKRLIIYEGFYHEVFNEPEHDRVLSDVEQWLDAHLVLPRDEPRGKRAK
jgi:acylglycerol lipase